MNTTNKWVVGTVLNEKYKNKLGPNLSKHLFFGNSQEIILILYPNRKMCSNSPKDFRRVLFLVVRVLTVDTVYVCHTLSHF